MATTVFSYHPPPDGDISLKSSDGTVFLAHTQLLRMASSVFADMLSTANRSDVVELGDDAESVSLMLRFIYPPIFTGDLPLDLVEKSLRMAQKYDVATITAAIDHLLLFHPSREVSLVGTQTVRLFCLAVTYGLRNTQNAAAEHLRPEHYRFKECQDIKELAAVRPSTPGIIGLLGAHCVCTRALAELFFGSEALEIWVRGQNESLLMCQECVEREYGSIPPEVYEPGWLPHWNILAFNELTTKPWSDCFQLRDTSCLDPIEFRVGVCKRCIKAVREARNGIVFWHFAHELLSRAEAIITDSECLYTL